MFQPSQEMLNLTPKTFSQLDIFIYQLYFDSDHNDQGEDEFIIFSEANKSKESKTKKNVC